uniref:Uncharacterized protein n=1 Tax=Candidatus Kentrum sp. DK TaxID=2126562 RepID=A0A450T2A3_9GAMM|nr:MAG: hypothetical protein BECKDK2373B_GA0170837_10948 [Candidatus Kentron sp. DK]VFJ61988.1 MAG: hypothetical protein BECKDK2373C_GA0170839_10937 [Candidatus Kentron sp. DK]
MRKSSLNSPLFASNLHKFWSRSRFPSRQTPKSDRLLADYQGIIEFDAGKPDGVSRKLLDTTRLDTLGWKAGIGLKKGLAHTYENSLSHPPGRHEGMFERCTLGYRFSEMSEQRFARHCDVVMPR